MANKYGEMALNMLVNGEKIKQMDKEHSIMLMVIYVKY